MSKKLILYTYSSDWSIQDHGGVSDGANPNMPHTFQVKESHNMIKFMPGDQFDVDRDDYPEGLYEEITKRGYDKVDIILINPKGRN